VPDSHHTESHNIPLVHKIIATAGFVGYIPWASGTFGSLAGLGIVFLPGVAAPGPLILLIIFFLFLGVRSSKIVAQVIGHQLTKSATLAKETFQKGDHDVPDPSIVVIDEVVGMWIALLFIPLNLVSAAIAFVSFRFFDIVKPPPARQVERIPRGWGIMLDDVVAGIYANLCTHAALFLLGLITGNPGFHG
jgi:phosphatidylglycerophosphatase A